MTDRTVLCAIPTFRRNALLAQLIESLQVQTFDDDDEARVELLVLDNDPDAGARDVVVIASLSARFPVHYVHVREPGLSAVRNAALAFTRGRYDFIAMIDDDERADPRWLTELLRVERWTDADAVVGPVLPIVPEGAPTWLCELRREETPLAADGVRLRDGWSCNALVRTGSIAALDLSFDPLLNFTGGEDQLFFRQLVARGGRIAFAAFAVARETIVPSRVSVRFNLMRSFRRGNSLSFCDLRLDGSPRAIGLRAAKGLFLIVAGALTILPLAAMHGRNAFMRTSCQIARGFGMLAGLVGMLYPAYRRGAGTTVS